MYYYVILQFNFSITTDNKIQNNKFYRKQGGCLIFHLYILCDPSFKSTLYEMQLVPIPLKTYIWGFHFEKLSRHPMFIIIGTS